MDGTSSNEVIQSERAVEHTYAAASETNDSDSIE
jgi:hypothetical protein